MEMFERCVREKVRFNYNGVITTEDLWDLHTLTLDVIYSEIQLKIERLPKTSLIKGGVSKEREKLEFKASVVAYVYKVKTEEEKERERVEINSQRRQKILKQIEEQEFKNLSIDELKEMLK